MASRWNNTVLERVLARQLLIAIAVKPAPPASKFKRIGSQLACAHVRRACDNAASSNEPRAPTTLYLEHKHKLNKSSTK